MDFKEVLEQIAEKSVQELTTEDIAFLKARRYYLTSGQKEKFNSVLEVSKTTKKTNKKSKK